MVCCLDYLMSIGSSVHRTNACTRLIYTIYSSSICFLKSYGFSLYSSLSLFLFFWYRPISKLNFLQFCLSSSTCLICFTLSHVIQHCCSSVLKIEHCRTILDCFIFNTFSNTIDFSPAYFTIYNPILHTQYPPSNIHPRNFQRTE